jgi:UDP-glucose 4-epimerase
MTFDTLTSPLSSLTSDQPTRWLLTGGCGFIGRNLIKNLLAEGGHQIRIIDNLTVGSREDLAQVCDFTELTPQDLLTAPSSVAPHSSLLTPHFCNSSLLTPHSQTQLVEGDILDEQLALAVTQGVDVIVHLAANTGVAPSVENPRLDCVTNVIGTLNYLEAARYNKVGRFIFASSGAPAGECVPPIHEELPPHPVSPYGASKLAGEGYCSAYSRTFGIDTVALRFSNVYGPLSTKKNSVVAKFIKLAMEDKPLEIFGDGSQTRDFIYIDDLIRAVRLAASVENIGGETFQIATARETTVGEMTELLIDIFQQVAPEKKIEIRYAEPQLGDVSRNFSDTTKARNILGWQAEMDLAQGIRKTLDWFKTCR